DVAQMYRVCDLVLLPGEVAGFGLPLLEAAISRVPVVCSDLPVFKEVVRDGAELVPARASGGEVAAAVERALARRTARHRRALIRRCSWAGVVASTERTIAAIMERGGGPPA